MDDTPRTLRAMLAEAKDTSELMVDLAYASVYFDDPDMAEEVDELEQRMSEMVHDMRAVCVLAARSSREAEGMSSVLQVVSAIERIANDAVDIARTPRRYHIGCWSAMVHTWPIVRSRCWNYRCRLGCGSWRCAGATSGRPTWTEELF